MEDYHLLLHDLDRFLPSLISELVSYDNSNPYEPYIIEFLYSIPKSGSFKVNLKFLAKSEKSSLTKVLSQINDQRLIELFTKN